MLYLPIYKFNLWSSKLKTRKDNSLPFYVKEIIDILIVQWQEILSVTSRWTHSEWYTHIQKAAVSKSSFISMLGPHMDSFHTLTHFFQHVHKDIQFLSYFSIPLKKKHQRTPCLLKLSAMAVFVAVRSHQTPHCETQRPWETIAVLQLPSNHYDIHTEVKEWTHGT